jgi:hypothetical protein
VASLAWEADGRPARPPPSPAWHVDGAAARASRHASVVPPGNCSKVQGTGSTHECITPWHDTPCFGSLGSQSSLLFHSRSHSSALIPTIQGHRLNHSTTHHHACWCDPAAQPAPRAVIGKARHGWLPVSVCVSRAAAHPQQPHACACARAWSFFPAMDAAVALLGVACCRCREQTGGVGCCVADTAPPRHAPHPWVAHAYDALVQQGRGARVLLVAQPTQLQLAHWTL